jgi:probable HAF family extracellular repeat protein
MPHAMNDDAQVVGDINSSGQLVAGMFSHGALYNLNDLIPEGSPWKLRTATSINNVGQIVGTGYLNSKPHAFLLTPEN